MQTALSEMAKVHLNGRAYRAAVDGATVNVYTSEGTWLGWTLSGQPKSMGNGDHENERTVVDVARSATRRECPCGLTLPFDTSEGAMYFDADGSQVCGVAHD